jgi:hypothetical protein
MTDEVQIDLPRAKVAFVIDGEVVDILHTDERLAAIFLSEPVILDVSDKFVVGEVPGVWIGDTYDKKTKTFTRVLPPQPTE